MTLAATDRPKKTGIPFVMGRVKSSHPRMLRLLVPLDFSGKSRQALRYAVPLAQRFSAQISLLHVLPAIMGRAARTAATAADRARARSHAVQRLDEMAATLLPRGVHAQNIVRSGTPAEEILEVARRIDADMIILTTFGQGGLKRFLLGSTAEQVMRRATCPVLSVRRQ